MCFSASAHLVLGLPLVLLPSYGSHVVAISAHRFWDSLATCPPRLQVGKDNDENGLFFFITWTVYLWTGGVTVPGNLLYFAWFWPVLGWVGVCTGSQGRTLQGCWPPCSLTWRIRLHDWEHSRRSRYASYSSHDHIPGACSVHIAAVCGKEIILVRRHFHHSLLSSSFANFRHSTYFTSNFMFQQPITLLKMLGVWCISQLKETVKHKSSVTNVKIVLM